MFRVGVGGVVGEGILPIETSDPARGSLWAFGFLNFFIRDLSAQKMVTRHT